MSGRFCASFDTEQTVANLVLGKWTSAGNSGDISFAPGNQGQCVRFANAGGSNYINLLRNLGASSATLFAKFHFRASALPAAAANWAIFKFKDSGTTQISLVLNSDGTLSAWRGDRIGGSVLGTTSGGISAGSFFSISISATFNNSTGSVVVKIGSATVLTLTNINTRQTANNSANDIQLGEDGGFGGGASTNHDYDDVVVNDSAGTVNNSFPDPGTLVGYKLPTGAGSNTQFTPDAGSNYARVNEADPDGDTSYVADGNVGDRDTYLMGACPANTGPIAFVQMSSYAKIDAAGSRSHANTCKSGASYGDGASNALGTSYVDYLDILEQDPNASAAWTKSTLDAAEFGSKVAA